MSTKETKSLHKHPSAQRESVCVNLGVKRAVTGSVSWAPPAGSVTDFRGRREGGMQEEDGGKERKKKRGKRDKSKCLFSQKDFL